MGDWSDKLDYEQREYYGHFYDPDREEETEKMTTVEILKEMAFTATETQRRALEDAISALSENKGEWTRHTRVEPVYSIDGVKTWGDKCQCNKCTFTTIAVEGFGYYNFCPNCGAKMKGGET